MLNSSMMVNPMDTILKYVQGTRPEGSGDAIAGQFGPQGQFAGQPKNQYGATTPVDLQNLFNNRAQATQARSAATKPVKKPAIPVRPGEAGLVGLGAIVAHLLGVDPSSIHQAYSGYMGQRSAAKQAEYENDVNAQATAMDQAKLQEELAHNKIQEWLLGKQLADKERDVQHDLGRERILDDRYIANEAQQAGVISAGQKNVAADNARLNAGVMANMGPSGIKGFMDMLHKIDPANNPATSMGVGNPLALFGGAKPVVNVPTQEYRANVKGAEEGQQRQLDILTGKANSKEANDIYKAFHDPNKDIDIRNSMIPEYYRLTGKQLVPWTQESAAIEAKKTATIGKEQKNRFDKDTEQARKNLIMLKERALKATASIKEKVNESWRSDHDLKVRKLVKELDQIGKTVKGGEPFGDRANKNDDTNLAKLIRDADAKIAEFGEAVNHFDPKRFKFDPANKDYPDEEGQKAHYRKVYETAVSGRDYWQSVRDKRANEQTQLRKRAAASQSPVSDSGTTYKTKSGGSFKLPGG